MKERRVGEQERERERESMRGEVGVRGESGDGVAAARGDGIDCHVNSKPSTSVSGTRFHCVAFVQGQFSNSVWLKHLHTHTHTHNQGNFLSKIIIIKNKNHTHNVN